MLYDFHIANIRCVARKRMIHMTAEESRKEEWLTEYPKQRNHGQSIVLPTRANMVAICKCMINALDEQTFIPDQVNGVLIALHNKNDSWIQNTSMIVLDWFIE